MQFVEFHAQSAFSFLAASSHPEELAEVAFEKGLPAIALLDRNGIYGAARLHFAAQKHGIKAHIGAEITVDDEPGTASPVLPLIAATQRGYQNLCQLITTTKLRAPKNKPTAATFTELRQHAEGLICLTGDERGVFAAALRAGDLESGRNVLQHLIAVMRQDEFEALAGSGALNNIGAASIHRRNALWQVAEFVRKSGELFRHTDEQQDPCPLPPMTKIQRVIADYKHTGMTTGPDPMFYCRPFLHNQGVLRASDVRKHPDGMRIKFAGNVIARQRPGDAHGVIFLRMKDESGIMDVIVYPDLYDQDRFLVLKSPFLLIHGTLQNQHGVVQMRANKLERFGGVDVETVSRNFR